MTTPAYISGLATDYAFLDGVEPVTMAHTLPGGGASSGAIGRAAKQSLLNPQYQEMRGALGLSGDDAVWFYWKVTSSDPDPKPADVLISEDATNWIIKSVDEQDWGPFYVLACTKAR